LAFLLLFWLHETVIKTQQMANNRLFLHLILTAFLTIIIIVLSFWYKWFDVPS
jgi:CHASE3 domain sensor protein